MTARRRPLLMVALVLVLSGSACTGAQVGGTAGASPSAVDSAPAAASRSPSADVSSPPPVPDTPQDAALAAYGRYMAASEDALAAGVGGAPLASVARGQALQHARDRLRANRREGVVATGSLQPSATATDVDFDGAGTATLTDCVLNGLEHVAADAPDRVVAAATGWRQPVEATVQRRGGEWIVTRIEVPLRDGSGRVPPPPEDPPYLRGPAQGPAPPSCVPPDLAHAAVSAYEAFRDAYDRAIGYGTNGPADPELPALAETAVDPQLSGAREFASELAQAGQAFRGEPPSRDPWAVAALEFDEKVIVYDCVTARSGGAVKVDSGQRAESVSERGVLRLDGSDVVRVDGALKVSGVSAIEDGLERCTSPTQ